jgi:hypothetical protein
MIDALARLEGDIALDVAKAAVRRVATSDDAGRVDVSDDDQAGDSDPVTARRRRLPAPPSWWGNDVGATRDTIGAMAEMRQFGKMKTRK